MSYFFMRIMKSRLGECLGQLVLARLLVYKKRKEDSLFKSRQTLTVIGIGWSHLVVRYIAYIRLRQ